MTKLEIAYLLHCSGTVRFYYNIAALQVLLFVYSYRTNTEIISVLTVVQVLLYVAGEYQVREFGLEVRSGDCAVLVQASRYIPGSSKMAKIEMASKLCCTVVPSICNDVAALLLLSVYSYTTIPEIIYVLL